jgi:hypothetical protein
MQHCSLYVLHFTSPFFHSLRLILVLRFYVRTNLASSYVHVTVTARIAATAIFSTLGKKLRLRSKVRSMTYGVAILTLRVHCTPNNINPNY